MDEIPSKAELNERLTSLAAQLVTIIIPRGDRAEQLVTFNFIAERDDNGVKISDVTLGTNKRATIAAAIRNTA